MASFWGRHGNVYVYIPNLIGTAAFAGAPSTVGVALAHLTSNLASPTATVGYARIACSLYAFAVAFSQPLACVGWYFLGWVLALLHMQLQSLC